MALILGVVLVCGLPGAGKSTLLESFLLRGADHQEDDADDVVPTTTTTASTCCVIEYDRVQAEQQQQHSAAATSTIDASSVEVGVESSGDDDELQAWRRTRRVALERLSKHIGSLISAAAGVQEGSQETKHHLIFLDDNFYLRSMRKQVYQACQAELLRWLPPQPQQTNPDGEINLEIRLGVVWLDSPLDLCWTRNAQRPKGQQVSNNVVRRMHARFEPPSPTSPLVWERQSFVRLVDTGGGGNRCGGAPDQQQQQLRDFVAILLRPDYSYWGRVSRPVKDSETAREELQQQRSTTRAATAADQFWRRCVTVTVQVLGRSQAAQANRVRRHCLAQQQQQQQADATGGCGCETEWLNLFLQGMGDQDDPDWLTITQKNVLRQALLPSNNAHLDGPEVSEID